MTKSKIRLGIVFTYILILIQVLFVFNLIVNSETGNFDDNKEIIYQISYAYVYVSILMVIRKLVINNPSILKYFTWIIQFEILKALSGLVASANIFQAKIIDSLLGLILITLYIILIVNILNKKYDNKLEIKGLRPFGIALLFGLMITLIFAIIAEYKREFEIYRLLSYLASTIPLGFIIGYFNKMKSVIEKAPNL
jgi:hypothetical protein